MYTFGFCVNVFVCVENTQEGNIHIRIYGVIALPMNI